MQSAPNTFFNFDSFTEIKLEIRLNGTTSLLNVNSFSDEFIISPRTDFDTQKH